MSAMQLYCLYGTRDTADSKRLQVEDSDTLAWPIKAQELSVALAEFLNSTY